jgi:dsRNA-specific ribonuclease
MNPNTYKVISIGELPQDLYLPPLPPIENADIEKRVFSHSSLFQNAKSGLEFEEEDHELVDNEKLEWIGDGILSG